jgi:HAD superfamily hydrolase (TIGR01509 family)
MYRLFVDNDLFNGFFNNPEVWLSMISLNLTILGLSSLTEKRNVLGVDYSSYLTDKFVLFSIRNWSFRLFDALKVFLAINGISLIVTFLPEPLWLKLIMLVLLLISLFGSGFYLLAYVVRINPGVRERIYMDEILGLYNNENCQPEFPGDCVCGMKKGYRTTKRLRTNVKKYFDTFCSESVEDFDQLFGPSSILYYHKDKINAAKNAIDSHDYSLDIEEYLILPDAEEDLTYKRYHISWEFFQLFRDSAEQNQWLLHILDLFNNGNYADNCPQLRLYNVARAFGQINRVGECEKLFHYKFLRYISEYIQGSRSIKGALIEKNTYDKFRERGQVQQHIKDSERYLFHELAKYMFCALERNNGAETFFEQAVKTIVELTDPGNYLGVITIEERRSIFEQEFNYFSSKHPNGSSMQQRLLETTTVTAIVWDFGNTLVKWDPKNLYDKHKIFEEGEYEAFRQQVLTDDWLNAVDKGDKSFAVLVDELIDKCATPDVKDDETTVRRKERWAKAIRAYRLYWVDSIKEEMPGMDKVMDDLLNRNMSFYALSNWSDETFKEFKKSCSCSDEASKKISLIAKVESDNTMISGREHLIKPDKDIYYRFFQRFKLKPSNCLFIDDRDENVTVSRGLGMRAVRFVDATQLASVLSNSLFAICP